MNYQFPPQHRLRSRADFDRLRRGKRWNHQGLVCVYLNNSLGHARLGMAVSTKFGNSVQRHWFKRHVREVFRQHDIHQSGLDILVFPKSTFQQTRALSLSLQSLFDQVCLKTQK